MLLLAIAVLRQLLSCGSILCTTKNLFFRVFLIFFQIFFSFINITFGFLCLFYCYLSSFLFFQFFLFFLLHSIFLLLLLFLHLQACSFICLNPIKLSSERLFLSSLRVFLLSETLLSIFAFDFCNDRQLFTTFNSRMYFLSPAAFPISKTLAQYMSIRFNFPSFSLNQLSGTYSTCSSLNWSCTNVSSHSVMTRDSNCPNLPILATDIVFLQFAGYRHFRYIKGETSKGRDFCRSAAIFT